MSYLWPCHPRETPFMTLTPQLLSLALIVSMSFSLRKETSSLNSTAPPLFVFAFVCFVSEAYMILSTEHAHTLGVRKIVHQDYESRLAPLRGFDDKQITFC